MRGATLRRTPSVRSPHMPQLRVSPGCALRHQLAPAGTLVSYVSVSGQTIGEPQLLPFARCHPLADTFIFISHGVPSGYVLSSVRVVIGAGGHMIWIAVCCKPSGLHSLLHSMSIFVMGHHNNWFGFVMSAVRSRVCAPQMMSAILYSAFDYVTSHANRRSCKVLGPWSLCSFHAE